MGERVQVRAVRSEPGSATAAAPGARSPDARSGFATRTSAALWPGLRQLLARIGVAAVAFSAGLIVTLGLAMRTIGGLRQAGFAIGMMCAVGGLGAALMHDGAGVFWMTIGGLLIGLSLRVPTRDRLG